jgi:hypothetical protein
MTDETILTEAKERHTIAVDGWKDVYDEAAKDLAFIYDVGEGQWPAKIRKDREDANRPVLTINKLLKFIRQLRGESLQNKPRMKVIPVDDNADVKMAELYDGLIRQIEYLSTANIAYDTAYMHAVSCSVGYIRLITKYTDDNSFNQDIGISRIINPFGVHFDPTAKQLELEDAKYCFVEEMVNTKEFKRNYPNADVSEFTGSTRQLFGDWLNGDQLRIAEYFWKEPITRTLVQLQDGNTAMLSDKITPDFIKSKGGVIIRDRKVRTHQVKWCKLSGAEVLEKADWPGKDIPIVPVFGDEIVVEGKKYYLSLLRGAKGSQEMYNYWATSATEDVALTPKMPYVVDHRQIKGFESEWNEAHRTNRMFIRYNAINGLSKPEREKQSSVPAAILSMMQTTAFDIEDHLGRYEASKGQASNERSGKAITARITQADKGTYVFVDNFVKAITALCRQVVDLVPKIYDTQRAIRIRGESDEEALIGINKPVLGEQGTATVENDLTVGKYDVIATAGGSFGSRRQEAVRTLIEAMQYAPNVAPIIAPFIFKYSDFPGSQEIYNEVKRELEKMKDQPPKGANR